MGVSSLLPGSTFEYQDDSDAAYIVKFHPWPAAEPATLVAAPDHQYLVASLGTDEMGTQPAAQADHDGAEHRTPEAHHFEAIHKPASQIEHARIEDQQKQAEGQNGEGKGEQNQHGPHESIDKA